MLTTFFSRLDFISILSYKGHMTLSKETTAWLTTLPSPSFILDETPLFGYAPPFPFEAFSNTLKTLFSLDSVAITPGDLTVRSPDLFLDGLGTPIIKKFAVS